MRSLIFIAVAPLLVSFLLPSCETGPDPVDRDPDAITMATPKGGKLPSALEGPVRSALGEPEQIPDSFRLRITGLVDSSYSLSLDDIHTHPASVTDTMIMYCVEGWEVWGQWKGVLVKDLLGKAGVQTMGGHVLFKSVEGYTTALPLTYLLKYDAMLAYQVNDTILPQYDGFPLRLVAFGKLGYKWAKWVQELEVIPESQLGFWEVRGYEDEAHVPLQRRQHYEGEDVEELDY